MNKKEKLYNLIREKVVINDYCCSKHCQFMSVMIQYTNDRTIYHKSCSLFNKGLEYDGDKYPRRSNECLEIFKDEMKLDEKEILYDIIKQNIIVNNCFCDIHCDYIKVGISKDYCILFEEELEVDGVLTHRCEECISFN